MLQIHPNARTTPVIRAEIARSQGRIRLPLRCGQPACAAGEGRHQARQALSKSLTRTGCVAAVEPASPQMDQDRASK
jgi:hypothetical protein